MVDRSSGGGPAAGGVGSGEAGLRAPAWMVVVVLDSDFGFWRQRRQVWPAGGIRRETAGTLRLHFLLSRFCPSRTFWPAPIHKASATRHTWGRRSTAREARLSRQKISNAVEFVRS